MISDISSQIDIINTFPNHIETLGNCILAAKQFFEKKLFINKIVTADHTFCEPPNLHVL